MFLSAGIGLRQNLLIPVSVRAGDRARKFSLDVTDLTDLWRRCASWDRVRQNRELTHASVRAVGSGKVESLVDPGIGACRGSRVSFS